jgi:O-antigen ligase
MILSAVIVAILSILQHFGFNLVPDDSYRVARSYGTLGNPNWLATYLVFIIPASIYFYISEKNRNYYFASVLMFSGLIVSGTRGCLISFVVLFTIISFMYNKQKKMLAYLVTGFMISTLVLLPTNNNIIQKRIGSIPQEITAAARLQDNAGSKRVYIWKETAKIITEYPILGVGLDNLNINMPNNVVMDKAHNIFLEILSTSGIFSFLLYASILLIIIARSRTYPVLFLMIFSYLLQGLFNNDVIMILPLFWIVLGLSLTNMQNDEGMWSTQHPRRAI